MKRIRNISIAFLLISATLLLAYWNNSKNELKEMQAWTAIEDVSQTANATIILNNWAKGIYKSVSFGGGTQSGARKDAMAIDFIVNNKTLCIHIPSLPKANKLDVRFSVHNNSSDNGDFFDPEYISHSILEDKDLRMAFIRMLEFTENDRSHPSHRKAWSTLASCGGERTWQDHQW